MSSVPKECVHFVGNTMIDSLYQNLNKIKQPLFWDHYGLLKDNYFLLTLHRPSNVDDPRKLKTILKSIIDSTENYSVVFPVHPRTRSVLNSLELDHDRLITINPQGYLEFIYLIKNTKGIITDSGGITEEATVLGIPCLTLRNSTERPETIQLGTNELIGDDYDKLKTYLNLIIQGRWKSGNIPPLWDGHTSERIVSTLCRLYIKKREEALIN
jgi:UDP-N-acetylglucosamine 2-epimerase (non-hydrolysing)